MRHKWKIKGQIERDLQNPEYKKRFDMDYEAFKLAVQFLLALEKKHWSYSDLARAIGTQKGHISRDLKGGGLRTASISRISKIANALDLKFFAVCVSDKKVKAATPIIKKLIAA